MDLRILVSWILGLGGILVNAQECCCVGLDIVGVVGFTVTYVGLRIPGIVILLNSGFFLCL
jgi:hypothetical protein